MRIMTTAATIVAAAAALAFVSTPAMACGGCGDYVAESIDAADYIYGGDTHYYEVRAERGELMYVDLVGYHDWADLDVIVLDERGRTVASGTSGFADETFDFVARREGVYTIEVVNLSSDCVEYDLTVY